MKPLAALPSPASEDRDAVAMRVADALADAVARGPHAALRTARALSEDELRLGLDFVSTVLEVASSSARVMAAVLVERTGDAGHRALH